MDAIEKIAKAMTALVIDYPFFGSLALRMKFVENKRVETATVNGVTLQYNTDYIEKLSVQQCIGMIAHCVMHVALGHVWRIGDRDLKTWNVATDYAINDTLNRTGFELPDGALTSPAYDNKPSEEIYTILQAQKMDGPGDGDQEGENKSDQSGDSGGSGGKGDSDGQDGKGDKAPDDDKNDSDSGDSEAEGDSNDPGGCGGVERSTESPEEQKESEQTWKAAVAQAASTSKGNLPGELQLQIDEYLNPHVPWHILLRDFVEKTARNDYDWTRPNRRYITHNIILPALISEELHGVVIAVDTSGSIDYESLNRFAAEASNVLMAYDTTIQVLYCDTQIAGTQTFTRADMPMEMKPKGGGGTRFQPVFDYIEKEGLEPSCVIYFTDMQVWGEWPDEPDYPVMWLATTDVVAPWGLTVKF